MTSIMALLALTAWITHLTVTKPSHIALTHPSSPRVNQCCDSGSNHATFCSDDCSLLYIACHSMQLFHVKSVEKKSDTIFRSNNIFTAFLDLMLSRGDGITTPINYVYLAVLFLSVCLSFLPSLSYLSFWKSRQHPQHYLLPRVFKNSVREVGLKESDWHMLASEGKSPQ